MKKSNLSDQPVFWIEQVPPKQDINKRDINRWGNRVKVRIMGVHSPNGTVTPDSGLAYAQVVHSTAHGSLNMLSTGIIGGEIVFGMYLNKDGTTLKNPFILGVLARTLSEYDETPDQSIAKASTEFKRVLPYWVTNPPASYQTKGGSTSPSTSPVQLPTQDFFRTNPSG